MKEDKGKRKRKLKHVIMRFEQISGMRVNFHISELIAMSVEELVHKASHIFN